MKRLLPPSPKRRKQSKPSKYPPKSVFDSEDFVASIPPKPKKNPNIREERVTLEADPPVDDLMTRHTLIDIEAFKKLWADYAEECTPKIMEVVAKAYAMIDVMTSLQEEMQKSHTDPSAEIVSEKFVKNFTIVTSHALIKIVADAYFPDPAYRDILLQTLLDHAVIKDKNSGEGIGLKSLKDMLGKLSKEDSTGPSDPFGLGHVEHIRSR